MASPDSTIQVLSKTDLADQTILNASSSSLPALASSTVRVRPAVLALTTNNLSYAMLGTFMGWWDTYPVPSVLPKPYNDATTHGIVPAWGYATVLQSTISELPAGTMLFGYHSFSSLPVDLRLQPAMTPGHWLDESPHRARLLPVYQRYSVADPSTRNSDGSPDVTHLAWDGLMRGLWETAYLINGLVFNATVPVHPLGVEMPWSSTDADLRRAAVVLLSASGKTAVAMAHQLKYAREPGTGPLAVVGLTSAQSLAFVRGTGFHDVVLAYEDIEGDGMVAAIPTSVERVILVDFGARDGIELRLRSRLQALLPTTRVTTIGVGGEAKPSPVTMEAMQELGAGIERVQANMSGLRSTQMERMGEVEYFAKMTHAWNAFRDAGVNGLELEWGEGIGGENGVEGGWARLCGKGERVPPQKGLVYRI